MTERLTQNEFDKHLDEGTLSLSLVGMSNVGKSFWSEKLAADYNFDRFCCDDFVEVQLDQELRDQNFAGGIEDVALWMGQPYDPQFPNTQELYLRHEAASVRAIMGRVATGRNSVIDTTGSVVYLDASLRQWLNDQTTVVHIEATQAKRADLFRKYLDRPKPVIWGESYRPRTSELASEALARCYPDLLDFRASRYAAMAHVTLPLELSESLHEPSEFLKYIIESLQTD
jgi:shikimate kinase